jgi:TPR repeat protein
MSLILPANPQSQMSIHSPSIDEPEPVRVYAYSFKLNTSSTLFKLNTSSTLSKRIEPHNIYFDGNNSIRETKIFERHILFIDDINKIPEGPLRSFFEAMSYLIPNDRLPENLDSQINNQHRYSPTQSLETLENLLLPPLPNDTFLPIIQTLLARLHGGEVAGISQNFQKSIELLKLAVDQGYAPAQHHFGLMNHGVIDYLPRNLNEAARLYKLAADQGYAPAQNELGVMYDRGEGNLPKDPIEAARLYKLAADQGYAPTQYTLGLRHMFGRPRNLNEAARLFKLAADQGYAPAQSALGSMYYHGEGNLPKDLIEAARLYKLAADQGEIEAKFMLEKLSPHQAMPTPKTPETPDQEPPEAPHPAPAPKAPPMSGPAPAYQAAVLSLQDQLKNQGQTISLQRQEILEGQKYEDEMRGLQNSVMTVQENELKRSSNSPDSAAKRLRPDAEANVDKG